ncbi:family 16 glycoside hydrolase [Thalassoroseus pseudoceratinae]|uniref:family 16 glycoside hydrolase n=1 Tax=Thalassoroseus pseudoceratinae TaxID=2713176 RepID=UPI0014213BEA|nr:family 16 glycoside hydrolase [Thalassoroseus pseudoceratinae]
MRLCCSLLVLLVTSTSLAAEDDGFRPLFDGKTLAGWEGDEKTFRVADGKIVAGTLDERIPRNEFLCTKKNFEDFELRLEAKLVGEGKNAGVQFRSQRIHGHHEVVGYQCDIGFTPNECIWGALYDESRRRKFLALGEQKPLLKKLKSDGWNELVIRCEGPRIQIWVNGVQTVDYTEDDKAIPLTGKIALQIHGGAPAEASYRNIRIKPLKKADPKTSFAPPAQLRRPAGLVAMQNVLLVANERTGTVSVIDAASRSVVNEVPVGKRLSDLTPLNDEFCLVVDRDEHAVKVLRVDGRNVSIASQATVAQYPVSAIVADDGETIAVSSLWSRRITFLHIDREPTLQLKPLGMVDLEFAPQELLWLPIENRLLVADAFRGTLAVVDSEKKSLVSQHEIPATNIRGLSLSADGENVFVAHQVLNSNRATTYDHIFWGSVMQNVLRSRTVASLLEPSDDEYPDTGEYYGAYSLGSPGDGTGDPGDVLILPSGETVLAVSGVNEIAVRGNERLPFERKTVGRRPTKLAASPDQKTVYIANTSDDTISVLDLNSKRIATTIPLGPPVERASWERGEELFHSAKLSLDSWFSCQSCHPGGHTTDRLNDNFGDGSTGAPKRVLSLLGAAHSSPWAWNGTSETLSQQVQKSVTQTMQGDELNHADVEALVDYMNTLQPPPGLNVARGTLDAAAIEKGRQVFAVEGCVECHRPPTYTSRKVVDVGIDDGRGGHEYNPPSLLGVSQRQRFFHDNSATSLEAVFKEHRHPLGTEIKPKDLAALLEFLRSL